ncbi:putative Pentatricopeptide repeat-containing protein [Abeliophyllum distichum]|uniref:Pentatricopeptide repeat-containing protein n=1 Tax=Abeliophyllum distichum TaxID=126358 RepID=A0ABD1NQL6_9LAMI
MSERQKLAELLKKCSRNLFLDQGKEVYGAVVRKGYGFDLMVNNDRIDMYGKCGRMSHVCEVFDGMLERNVVSWTVLMCGYSQEGNAKASLSLFGHMGFSGVKPNEYTFSTNIKACAFLSVLENGMQIHGLNTKSGFDGYHVVEIQSSICSRNVEKSVTLNRCFMKCQLGV